MPYNTQLTSEELDQEVACLYRRLHANLSSELTKCATTWSCSSVRWRMGWGRRTEMAAGEDSGRRFESPKRILLAWRLPTTTAASVRISWIPS